MAIIRRTSGGRASCAAASRTAAQASSASGCAMLNNALAYGRASVASSAMIKGRVELIKRCGVGAAIHLALQNTLSAAHNEVGHLIAQRCARLRELLLNLHFRLRH